MLWGARGMGKSSLVKAAHAAANAELPGSLALIEIHREDIRTLPDLLDLLRAAGRAAAWCSATTCPSRREDADYKALKSVLDGGIEGRPAERAVLRDLQPPPPDVARHDRERAQHRDQPGTRRWRRRSRCPTASACGSASTTADQDTFFAMIDGYAAHFGLPIGTEELHAQAIEWSVTRGGRSGRVAWQFIQDLAGRLGVKIAA